MNLIRLLAERCLAQSGQTVLFSVSTDRSVPTVREAYAMHALSAKMLSAPLFLSRVFHANSAAHFTRPCNIRWHICCWWWNDVTESMATIRSPFCGYNGPITIAIRARFGYEMPRDAYDSSAIRARYNILRGVMCFRAIMNMSILLCCCRML